MSRFEVLEPSQELYQNTVLEASAGTGKTFTIEHLVVRLLIEGKTAPSLEEILVVTFTRAATQELQLRVRANIQAALTHLTQFLAASRWPEGAPPYLVQLEDLGTDTLRLAKRRLQAALLNFSAARIFTIHSFCYRSLREARSEFSGDDGCEPILPSQLRQVIRDFFRTELGDSLLSPGQMNLLLAQHKQDIEALEARLARWIVHPLPIRPGFVLRDLKKAIEKAQLQLRSGLVEQIEAAIFQYKGLCDRQKQVKAFVHRACETLRQFGQADLTSSSAGGLTDEFLDELIGPARQLLQAMDPTQLLKRVKDPVDTGLVDQAREILLPLLEQAADPLHIFATLASSCQSLLRRRQRQEGWRGPDDLLAEMARAAESEAFCEDMAAHTKVAIIDEFQDTDPLQWKIFRRLFVGRSTLLYLVGDPKQSIYAFRQADIYTYLDASRQLASGLSATLDVNYRSQAKLVEALNALFCAEHVGDWISLPKTQSALEYRPVSSPEDMEVWSAQDQRGALHFMVAEGAAGRSRRWPTEDIESGQLFPFLVAELQRLREGGMSYHDCAILVRDRYQAQRVRQVLQDQGIPCLLRRTESVLKSPVYRALQDLLRAVMHPKNPSDLRVALGSCLLAWTDQDLLRLQNSAEAAKVFARFQDWRQLFVDRGFGAFYRRFLLEERHHILAREGGLDLWEAFQQLCELLIEEQAHTRCAAEGVISFLQELPSLEMDEDSRILLRQDPEKDAVQILSIHMSKGLEFPIVFALGLCQRTQRRPELVAGAEFVAAYRAGATELEEHYQELDAEKMRQLYVAMTRAKLRLYVPLADQTDLKRDLQVGECSATELFFQRIGTDLGTQLAHLKQLPHCTITRLCHEPPLTQARSEQMSPQKLEAPRPIEPNIQALRLLSFTALAEAHGGSSLRPPEDILPAGPQTGVIVHELLETIARRGFAAWLDEPRAEAGLMQRLQGTALEAWGSECMAMLRHAIQTPLSPGGFSLAQVQRCIPELEFLYQDAQGRLIKGFVDLVVEYESQLYIIDWKSNYLLSYETESLQACIEAHDYQLQAKLYTEAVERWANGQLPVAGTYYVFLRGLPEHGIYHFPPQTKENK